MRLYGLGVLVPIALPIRTTSTVVLDAVELCGHAEVRYSQPCPSGYRVSLKFRQALFMQSIPGLDAILMYSFYNLNNRAVQTELSFAQRLWLLVWRALNLR